MRVLLEDREQVRGKQRSKMLEHPVPIQISCEEELSKHRRLPGKILLNVTRQHEREVWQHQTLLTSENIEDRPHFPQCRVINA